MPLRFVIEEKETITRFRSNGQIEPSKVWVCLFPTCQAVQQLDAQCIGKNVVSIELQQKNLDKEANVATDT